MKRKKRIVEINSYNFASTGNITLQIADTARKKGYKVYTCCPLSRDNKKKIVSNQIFIGNRISRNLHLKLAEWTGFNGCFSILSTYRFLHIISLFHPDIIHLHNLHNCYINLPMLFRFLKKRNLKVIWTLHDCWSFTGHCPYFDSAKCRKWVKGCYQCPQIREYPYARIDQTKRMWKLKKKWFTGLKDMTIVVPSRWLAGLVKHSFLKEYPVTVINNGIDLQVFKPTESNFKAKYSLDDKFIILGVAMSWDKRKGLDVFIKLAKRLDERFQIVLIGTNDDIDAHLPANIISIHRTTNQNELAEIYTAADLFVNPTREDNYPTVNMESIACGTPVLTFNTGGSPESLDEKTGTVVDVDDIEALTKQIMHIYSDRPFSESDCLERAKSFNKDKAFKKYVELYN